MKNEKLVSEVIGQANGLNDNLQNALAEYLTATARYNIALAERKEIEVQGLKEPPVRKSEVKREEDAWLSQISGTGETL